MTAFRGTLVFVSVVLIGVAQILPIGGIPPGDEPIVYNEKNSPEAEQFLRNLFASSHDPVPETFDWRDVNYTRVSQPKFQKLCDASWAFAALGLLEGQLYRFGYKTVVDLSAQNLIDCSAKNDGCFGVAYGSSLEEAINFVVEQGGVQNESSYPYRAREQKCLFDKDKAIVKGVKGFAYLPANDTQKLKETIATYGPVLAYMDGSRPDFINAGYYSDVYVDSSCSSDPADLLHPTLLVGYGKHEKLGEYWIVKNSWSWFRWGNNGFLNVSSINNQCGLASKTLIATF